MDSLCVLIVFAATGSILVAWRAGTLVGTGVIEFLVAHLMHMRLEGVL